MNQEETKLRSLIRKGINIILERKETQKNEEGRFRNVIKHLINSERKAQPEQCLEEKRLRNIISYLIYEVKGKTDVADKVIHKSTGINVLDTLLKNIIKQIESYYKDLSSNEVQRKSFRYHFLVNFKNALAPINANRAASDAPTTLAEQDVKISIDDELEADDLADKPDESKFLPSRPEDEEEAKEEAEEKEGFIKLDSDDPSVQQGAAFAEKAWNDVQNQIQTAYEDLINPEDAATFYDWGLTNLKLYFDKFEDEIVSGGEVPESPDYPPEEGGGETEEEFEI